MMKKVVFILLMIGLLSACSNNTDEAASENEQANNENVSEEQTEDEAGETNDSPDTDANDNENVEVDKNRLSVEVTLPSSLVDSKEQLNQESIAEAEEDGLKMKRNDDGGLTYKMSKSKHAEMMDELRADAEQSIQELTESGDFPSIHTINSNESFSEFEVMVDQKMFENSMDSFALMGIGMSGMMYQLFDGVSEDDYDVNIEVKDVESKEVFDTVHYPDVMEETSQE